MPTPRKAIRVIENPTAEEMLDYLIPTAIKALHDVLVDPMAPAGARVSAAREILDRTKGKPLPAMEKDEPEPVQLDMQAARASSEYMRLRSTYMHLPDDELPEHIRRALAGLQAQIDADKGKRP